MLLIRIKWCQRYLDFHKLTFWIVTPVSIEDLLFVLSGSQVSFNTQSSYCKDDVGIHYHHFVENDKKLSREMSIGTSCQKAFNRIIHLCRGFCRLVCIHRIIVCFFSICSNMFINLYNFTGTWKKVLDIFCSVEWHYWIKRSFS